MTEKELKKLNRYQLLELLMMQTEQNEKLQQEKEQLQAECEKLQFECAKVKEYVFSQEKRNDDNLAKFREDTASAYALLKSQLHAKNIAITILSVISGILLLVLILT